MMQFQTGDVLVFNDLLVLRVGDFGEISIPHRTPKAREFGTTRSPA
jgi:hypothetical protein